MQPNAVQKICSPRRRFMSITRNEHACAFDSLKQARAASLPEAVGARLDSIVEAGELQDLAVRRLSEGSYDLFVLGTHGRGGLAHAAIGSQAATLLETVDCDVLMVRGRKG